MHAALSQFARVGGAVITVITDHAHARADAALAGVDLGTCVAVITQGGVGGEDTPGQRIAGVVRARVPIVTVDTACPHTSTLGTCRLRRTRIAIITGLLVGREDAGTRITAIIRADIAIRTGNLESACTTSVRTHIVDSARIIVATR